MLHSQKSDRKPITDIEWKFWIVDGPSGSYLVLTLAEFKLDLGIVSGSRRRVYFKIRRDGCRWITVEIQVWISTMQRSRNDGFIIEGWWLNAKFEHRPFAFRAEYYPKSKQGTIVFSFKYGQWAE